MEYYVVFSEKHLILGEFYRENMAHLFQNALKAKGITSTVKKVFEPDED